VISNRIREDLKLGIRGTFKKFMNQAESDFEPDDHHFRNGILSYVVTLRFWGGSINDFAFTFRWGSSPAHISSIYIASALVLWWHKGQRPHIGTGQSKSDPGAAVRT